MQLSVFTAGRVHVCHSTVPCLSPHEEKPYGIRACRYGNDTRGESSAGLTSKGGGFDGGGSFG